MSSIELGRRIGKTKYTLLLKLADLLKQVQCPQCEDKSGAFYDNQGNVHQCQWCYEANDTLERLRDFFNED